MQIAGKIFPYPVLNHNKSLSNYKQKKFELYFEDAEDANNYILQQCKFYTDSEFILNLYRSKKISIVLIVECSYTVYRKMFTLTEYGNNIYLPKSCFNDKVFISMYAYANEDLIISSSEIDDDYKDIDFEIEKYDIVAIDDGFNLEFIHEDNENNFVQSIFSILPDEENKYNSSYFVDFNLGRKISIFLSIEEYNCYKIVYTVPTFKEVFFNMILIPSLIEGLSLCKSIIQDDLKEIDDICEQYTWFRSICSAFKKIKGRDISVSDLKDESLSTLAQELLGNPLGGALKSLVNEVNGISEGGDFND